MSPDGKFAYVGSYGSPSSGSSLTAFSRDPATGALTQLPGIAGCYTADGSSGAGPGTCTAVRDLGNGDGRDLAITSDGRFAYFTGQSTSSVALFSRDPETGVLTQLPGSAGCILRRPRTVGLRPRSRHRTAHSEGRSRWMPQRDRPGRHRR